MKEGTLREKHPLRDYPALAKKLLTAASVTDRDERMRAVTDLLWEGLSGQGVHWLGFYKLAEAGDAMVLVACRPRPACSPIGMHGVCGKACIERRSQVVEDVFALGDAHIVCDPSNLSEVVVPLQDPGGSCREVLDLDSRERGSFTQEDADGLATVLRAAGLTV